MNSDNNSYHLLVTCKWHGRLCADKRTACINPIINRKTLGNKLSSCPTAQMKAGRLSVDATCSRSESCSLAKPELRLGLLLTRKLTLTPVISAPHAPGSGVALRVNEGGTTIAPSGDSLTQ